MAFRLSFGFPPNRLLLKITADGWVTEQSENIVLLAKPVALFVIQKMMILVVPFCLS
jgi:hypothetical protein